MSKYYQIYTKELSIRCTVLKQYNKININNELNSFYDELIVFVSVSWYNIQGHN